jgi:hypothetical protein
LHTTFRPATDNEHANRNDALCLRKLQGEENLSTKKTIPGWNIDTDTFRVLLPLKQKHGLKISRKPCNNNKKNECTPTKELESLIPGTEMEKPTKTYKSRSRPSQTMDQISNYINHITFILPRIICISKTWADLFQLGKRGDFSSHRTLSDVPQSTNLNS